MATQLFGEIYIFYGPMGPIQFPFANVEFKSQIYKLPGGQKWCDFDKIVFDPNHSLPFYYFAQYSEFWIKLVK